MVTFTISIGIVGIIYYSRCTRFFVIIGNCCSRYTGPIVSNKSLLLLAAAVVPEDL